MEYKKLGNSNVEVSVVTFGAWAIGGWLWGGADKSAALKAIQKGYDLGITSIDTAPVYGFGQSEDIVGEAIKGKRDKFQILTKYGLQWNTSKGEFYFNSEDNQGNPLAIHRYAGKDSIIKECEGSLKRLGTDYIDLYQIHWSDPTTPMSETMEAMELLHKQGKIKAAGVCNYTADQMKDAERSYPIVSNQVPYSMVKRDIEEDVIPYCESNNKSILAYSPLQRGLLTGKITPGYKFNEGDNRSELPYYRDENIIKINRFLDNITPITENKNATFAQIVLRWTIQRSGNMVVLAGARNNQQISDNARAGEIVLSDEELLTINRELDKLELNI